MMSLVKMIAYKIKSLGIDVSRFNSGMCRSSRPEVFYKEGVLRNFVKFTGNLRTPFLTEEFRWLLLYLLQMSKVISTFGVQKSWGKSPFQLYVDATYLKVPVMRSKQIPLFRRNAEKKYIDSSKFLPRNKICNFADLLPKLFRKMKF